MMKHLNQDEISPSFEVPTEDNHQFCGSPNKEKPKHSFFSYQGSIGAIVALILRLLDAVKNYNKEHTAVFTVVFDKTTGVWNKSLVDSVMKQVIQFYKKYKITVQYKISIRNGVKQVEDGGILPIESGDGKVIFLVDKYSNTDNGTKGYHRMNRIVVRYEADYRDRKKPSTYLWTAAAHEIGHILGLEHGGSGFNLMKEDGPGVDQIGKVKLTICQVGKIKR